MTTRSYLSPLRAAQAQQTRAAILDSAERLFTSGGYVGTRLTDVAADAAVSVASVKLIFGTKTELLLAVWHRTLAGGPDDQVPVADRPWMRAVFEIADPVAKIAQLARMSAMVRKRIAPLSEVIDAAAPLDAAIADLARRTGEEFYANQRAVIKHLRSAGHLRPELTIREAADILWTLNSTRVYSLLVGDRSWTHKRYERWLAETLQRELLTESTRGNRTGS